LSDRNVLIVADMVGGAPFQQAAILSLDKDNVNVIGGVNLSAILEVVFSLHTDIDQIAKTMIDTTINSVKVIKP
jgi:N-acetylgalactosamine PTS system EIIA component